MPEERVKNPFTYPGYCLLASFANQVFSDGKYCNVWYLEDAAKADSPDCDECYLKLPYIEAQSPAAGDPDEAKSIYESLSASCTYNGPSITNTVANLVLSS